MLISHMGVSSVLTAPLSIWLLEVGHCTHVGDLNEAPGHVAAIWEWGVWTSRCKISILSFLCNSTLQIINLFKKWNNLSKIIQLLSDSEVWSKLSVILWSLNIFFIIVIYKRFVDSKILCMVIFRENNTKIKFFTASRPATKIPISTLNALRIVFTFSQHGTSFRSWKNVAT